MKNSIRIIAVSAFASLFAFAAHAGAQGEGDSAADIAPTARSTASSIDVKAGARMPVHMTDGSAHVASVLQSGLSRESVKQEALIATLGHAVPQGELGAM